MPGRDAAPFLRREAAWTTPPQRKTQPARWDPGERERLLIAIWPTGAPNKAVARALGVSPGWLTQMLTRLREQGVCLPYRVRYRHPPDWRERLDAVMLEYEGLKEGVGGPDSQK